ncbi:MAG: sigma-54-dependent Fis family transcriptional regulator [Myxococcales bacterium]|nr:sigma-54-dependent Fis family transcriptional regulator [Myxococcales bacterium]
MVRPRVLVAEDEEALRDSLSRILAGRFEVVTAQDGRRALDLGLAADFDVVVSDVGVPGLDGVALLRELKRAKPDLEVVLVAANGEVHRAVEAMKEGAYDYLREPFEPDEALLTVVRAAERKSLREQARALTTLRGSSGKLDRLVGKSAAMQHAFESLVRASASDAPVLITGERGSGKELAARAVHASSARSAGPFVSVRCGAVPEHLLESELFGHARGAFIGAETDRRGLFEEAHGGTLYLDEIGALPPFVQVKLCQALDRHAIRRLGEDVDHEVRTRVVAATDEDLAPAIAAGSFRGDLFYRLCVLPIRLPPLRERMGDIPALARALLERLAGEYGLSVEGFTQDAMAAMLRYLWPGNVGELENAIERALIVTDGARIPLEALPEQVAFGASVQPPDAELGCLAYRAALDAARDRASHQYLAALMRRHEGSVTRAAETAGVERETLHRLLKRHGLRSDDFRRR